jgi:type I restriction enzyme R subunit
LSNILKTFNELYGDIAWADADRIRKLIAEDIPAKVSADTAYLNARANSDKQNARVEFNSALQRAIVSFVKDDTELYKQYSDNPDFKRWLADTVFDLTYQEPRRRSRLADILASLQPVEDEFPHIEDRPPEPFEL